MEHGAEFLAVLFSPATVVLAGVGLAVIVLCAARLWARTVLERRIDAALRQGTSGAHLLSVTVLTQFTTTDSFRGFLQHIRDQNYRAVEVFIVFDSLEASRQYSGACRRTARRLGVNVHTITAGDTRSLLRRIHRRVSSDIIVMLTPEDRLSVKCLEYLSMAFTQPVQAVRVPRSIRLDHSLATAGLALAVHIREVLWWGSVRPTPMVAGLIPYVAVRTIHLDGTYRPSHLLSDLFRVEVPRSNAPALDWTIWATALTALATALLWVVVGPVASVTVLLSLYCSMLVLVASSVVLVKNEVATRRWSLVWMVPFAPIVIVALSLIRHRGKHNLNNIIDNKAIKY